MKFIHILLIVILLLVVNDIILIKYLGLTAEERVADFNHPSQGAGEIQNELASAKENKLLEPTQPAAAGEIATIEQGGQKSLKEKEFIATMRSVAKSGELLSILDELRLESQNRQVIAEQRIAQMDIDELYDTILNATLREESVMAESHLQRRGLSQLSTEQLKNLYQNSHYSDWSKPEIVKLLLERNDSDGLIWAKELLVKVDLNGMFVDPDLLNYVYANDPSFIKNYISDFNPENTQDALSKLMFITQEPAFAKDFYEKNLDKIIDSNNSQIYQIGIIDPKIDLTSEQQNKILNLMNSNTSSKRSFAANLANKIERVDLLEDAFVKLTGSNERAMFIYSLMSDNNKPEHVALGKQLAENSDDLNIQGFIQSTP